MNTSENYVSSVLALPTAGMKMNGSSLPATTAARMLGVNWSETEKCFQTFFALGDHLLPEYLQIM